MQYRCGVYLSSLFSLTMQCGNGPWSFRFQCVRGVRGFASFSTRVALSLSPAPPRSPAVRAGGRGGAAAELGMASLWDYIMGIVEVINHIEMEMFYYGRIKNQQIDESTIMLIANRAVMGVMSVLEMN